MVQNDKLTPEDEAAKFDEEVKELIANGKKYLLCSDYNDAVASFQDACTMLSEKYGQMGCECAEVYYYYGVSLLELARLENGVLGNALKGVPEDEDQDSEVENEQFEKPNLKADEREQLRKEVEDAMATENEEDEEKSEKEDKEEKPTGKEQTKDIKMCEDKTESTTTDKEKESPSCKKEEKPGTSTAESTEEEDPDDISTLQLSWEMLECAKIVFKNKENNKENGLMIAQCHLKLGELGLEVENYPQAIGDFLECLVIQKEHIEETDRKLAETYYNLGLAYNFEKRYDNALEHYRNALSVLESRIELLNKAVVEDEDKEKKEIEECKEIGELKDLIPDINSKIEDVLLAKKTESRLGGSPFRQTGESSSSFGASGDDKTCSVITARKVGSTEAGDIDHLVRRKRPSSDVENSKEDNKKLKQEENGKEHSNGHGIKDEAKTIPTNTSPTSLKKKVAAAGDAPAAMET